MDLFDTTLQVQVIIVHFTRVSPFVPMGHYFHAITEHACLFFPLTLAPIGRALILERSHCIGLPPCTMLSWFFQTLIASCCLCPVRYRMGGKMELGGSLQVVGDELERGEKGKKRDRKIYGVFSWWKSLVSAMVAHFIIIWQLIFNHKLISIIRFIS